MQLKMEEILAFNTKIASDISYNETMSSILQKLWIPFIS